MAAMALIVSSVQNVLKFIRKKVARYIDYVT